MFNFQFIYDIIIIQLQEKYNDHASQMQSKNIGNLGTRINELLDEFYELKFGTLKCTTISLLL